MRVCQSVVVWRACVCTVDGKFFPCINILILVFIFRLFFFGFRLRVSDPSFFKMMMMVLLALEAIKYVDIHGVFLVLQRP